LTTFRNIFSHAVPVKGPCDRSRLLSPAQDLLRVPLKKSQTNKRRKETRKQTTDNKAFKIEDCLLSKEELIMADIVIPGSDLKDGWVETEVKPDDWQRSSPFYAIDCEMVRY
jgi:hypothetical protein